MKKYDCLLIGYKDPNMELLKEFIRSEADYIEAEHNNHKLLFNPVMILRYTDEINPDKIKEWEKENRLEYQVSYSDLGTKADCHKVTRCKVTI